MATRKVDLEKERKRAKQPGAGYPIRYPPKDETVERVYKEAEEKKRPPAWRRTERAYEGEPKKDEHGCIIGKEIYDKALGKCMPIPAEQTPTDVSRWLATHKRR